MVVLLAHAAAVCARARTLCAFSYLWTPCAHLAVLAAYIWTFRFHAGFVARAVLARVKNNLAARAARGVAMVLVRFSCARSSCGCRFCLVTHRLRIAPRIRGAVLPLPWFLACDKQRFVHCVLVCAALARPTLPGSLLLRLALFGFCVRLRCDDALTAAVYARITSRAGLSRPFAFAFCAAALPFRADIAAGLLYRLARVSSYRVCAVSLSSSRTGTARHHRAVLDLAAATAVDLIGFCAVLTLRI